jgi:hypothetical protein
MGGGFVNVGLGLEFAGFELSGDVDALCLSNKSLIRSGVVSVPVVLLALTVSICA